MPRGRMPAVMGGSATSVLGRRGLAAVAIAAALDCHRATVAGPVGMSPTRDRRSAMKASHVDIVGWLATKAPVRRMLELVREQEPADPWSQSALDARVSKSRGQ